MAFKPVWCSLIEVASSYMRAPYCSNYAAPPQWKSKQSFPIGWLKADGWFHSEPRGGINDPFIFTPHKLMDDSVFWGCDSLPFGGFLFVCAAGRAGTAAGTAELFFGKNNTSVRQSHRCEGPANWDVIPRSTPIRDQMHNSADTTAEPINERHALFLASVAVAAAAAAAMCDYYYTYKYVFFFS